MKNISNPLISALFTKSITQLIPSCSISILVISGYFSIVLGGLMIGFGGALVYQSLRPNPQENLEAKLLSKSEIIEQL
ncbi:hypothetical protein VB715_00980 [Crocosphaera sp. UHCC 0190]|uniref:hypothetical protein n=1 Tax=Crocosphaera sp. UHCC 0190 TaxID=3110246 RepID=UPI002B20C667|nr:hypothetical protein [Crocosphaera sp. UHCC 0190]MEA5508328.1 hypothetical protein [Crocosphaera sp. UHCC 0190]